MTEPTRSDRGLAYFEPVPSVYGGHARVYESSAASGPHVWLKVESPVDLNEPDGPTQEGVAHLTLEDAEKLGKQLLWFVENHYQRG